MMIHSTFVSVHPYEVKPVKIFVAGSETTVQQASEPVE